MLIAKSPCWAAPVKTTAKTRSEGDRESDAAQGLLDRCRNRATAVIGLARYALELVVSSDAEPAVEGVDREPQAQAHGSQRRDRAAPGELGSEHQDAVERHPHPGTDEMRHLRAGRHDPHRKRLELRIRLAIHEPE